VRVAQVMAEKIRENHRGVWRNLNFEKKGGGAGVKKDKLNEGHVKGTLIHPPTIMGGRERDSNKMACGSPA